MLRAGDGGATWIEDSGEHLWPDTLGIMGWNVDPQGFGVIFQPHHPELRHRQSARCRHGDPRPHGARGGRRRRFVCHPGGTKVVQALESALRLDQGALDHERAVLADYGNMSAPTALFVLDRVLKSGLPSRSLLTALGPGFTASCVSIRHAA